jgi:cation transport regulator ChaC
MESIDSAALIFGYGSLISAKSLKATVPTAKELRPAYIKGFRRDFSLLDTEGWVSSNLDVAGVPFCSVDVHKIEDSKAHVNGVIFKVGEEELPALLEREKDYALISTAAYDFRTDELLGECAVFSAGKHNGKYDFDSAAQKRYLEVCLEAAEEYGVAFREEFLRSTYIGDQPIGELLSVLI